MINRSVSVIYCDDIRQEVGQKKSFIGVYQSVLFLSEIPATLPKLCIAITAYTDASAPFKKLRFRILMGEEAILEADVSPEELAKIQAQAEKDSKADSPNRFQALGLEAILSPLQLNEPSILRVRVQTETEELKGPELSIQLAPSIAVAASNPKKTV